jgi:hypothetical protein
MDHGEDKLKQDDEAASQAIEYEWIQHPGPLLTIHSWEEIRTGLTNSCWCSFASLA